MQAKPFYWYDETGKRHDYISYCEAARQLGVSENAIRYYVKRNIHSKKQLRWKRDKA